MAPVHIGVFIGIALGGTAISIPVSVVAKHFPQSNRTLAMGIVTASGSFGFFVSPIFTRYSLVEYGWENTLLFFAVFVFIGLILAFLLTTPKDVVGGKIDDKHKRGRHEQTWRDVVLDVEPRRDKSVCQNQR